tara:strand:- start:1241 stop:1684 length:444 start_codon:yes stop_codon:yes gene_type:complete
MKQLVTEKGGYRPTKPGPKTPPTSAPISKTSILKELEYRPKGSRELDDSIATFLWGEARPMGNSGEQKVLTWNTGGGCCASIAPKFTTDLSDLYRWLLYKPHNEIYWGLSGPINGKYNAAYGKSTGTGSTPTLALCAAIVREYEGAN